NQHGTAEQEHNGCDNGQDCENCHSSWSKSLPHTHITSHSRRKKDISLPRMEYLRRSSCMSCPSDPSGLHSQYYPYCPCCPSASNPQADLAPHRDPSTPWSTEPVA